jgi:hypothetical protein
MMTTVELEGKGIHAGDRVYVQYANGIVRSGVCLGLQRLPMDPRREGLCITYDARQSIVDWIDPGYIDQVEVTIPKDVLESVLAGSAKNGREKAGVE